MKIKLQNSKPIPVTSTPDCFKCDVKITGEMYFCNSNYGTNHPICESCMKVNEVVKQIVEIGNAVSSGDFVINMGYYKN